MTWFPIDTLTHNLPVLRPHYCWGPIAVRRRYFQAKFPYDWVTADLSNSYPEEAFLPFFMPCPAMPAGVEMFQAPQWPEVKL